MIALNSKFARKSVPVQTKPFNRQKLFQLINCSKCCSVARTHALSLDCHWSMALSMTLCLNSAQTEIHCCSSSTWSSS